MKKSTFFTGLLTLMFSTSAIAQDLTIEAADFIIEESGRLDKLTGCIQNTGESTRICLGEVDFGENGDKYAAAGIVFTTESLPNAYVLITLRILLSTESDT